MVVAMVVPELCAMVLVATVAVAVVVIAMNAVTVGAIMVAMKFCCHGCNVIATMVAVVAIIVTW